MTLHTRKNYICTCVSFINILTELPKPSTTTLAYMEDYDEKTHIKGKMRFCGMITQENGEGQNHQGTSHAWRFSTRGRTDIPCTRSCEMITQENGEGLNHKGNSLGIQNLQ